jgi:hypothetical protein
MRMMKFLFNKYNIRYLFLLGTTMFSVLNLCYSQKNFLEGDREIVIEDEKSSTSRYRLGFSVVYNHSIHDYGKLDIARDYCEECFANAWGDGYTLGLAVEYMLGEQLPSSPSFILRFNYEYMPALASNDNYKLQAIVYKNENDYEKVFATMFYRADYDLRFWSADILYKINMPGTGLFAYLGPSINFNTRHKVDDKFELLEPADKMLPKDFFWLEKRYQYSNKDRTVVYREDIVKKGNYTRVGFKAGISFPIKINWLVINPFFQFYYSFRNYESYEESQVNAWCGGVDVMFVL